MARGRWLAVAVAAAVAGAEEPAVQHVPAEGSPLRELALLQAEAGRELSAVLELRPVRLDGPRVSILTRALNGTVPGPGLAVRPGATFRVRYLNRLEAPLGPERENNYHYPNTSNLHTHGLHVAPKQPGDDVLKTVVQPGGSWQYEYHLIPDHSPGTYWIHPHAHGSAVLQIGGGAALPLVVLDPPGFLSPQLEAIDDTVLMLQELSAFQLQRAAATARDELFKVDRWDWGNAVWLVNGAPAPVMDVQAGAWRRLRMIGAGTSSWLNLYFDGCEVALLAKDGVYIQDFPRVVTRAVLPPGGRADVVVRCAAGRHRVDSRPSPNASSAQSYEGLVFEISASDVGGGSSSVRGDLEPWAPASRPRYLQDLRAEKPDCSCETSMGLGGNTLWLEHHLWEGRKRYLHRSPQDGVVERRLSNAAKHPYHAHNYPYQLVSRMNGSDDYFKVGDWHDTYLNAEGSEATVRFHTVDFWGPQVVHCHILGHTDRGMIAVEMVRGKGRDACGCNLLDLAERRPAPPALSAAAPESFALAVVATGLFVAMLGTVLFLGLRAARSWREEVAQCYQSLPEGPCKTAVV